MGIPFFVVPYFFLARYRSIIFMGPLQGHSYK